MKNDKPYREWWIRFDADELKGHKCRGVSDEPWEPKYPGEMIHVIEKSAYDELKAENEKIHKQWTEKWQQALDSRDPLLEEYDQLKQQAEKLANVLEDIYEQCGLLVEHAKVLQEYNQWKNRGGE